MSSPIPLIIALLKNAPAVVALVDDRIDPAVAIGTELPRIVLRQSTGRQVYGLSGSARLREARVSILCAAVSFTASDRLAVTTIAALKDIRHVPIGSQRVTLFQDGEDTGTWDEQGQAFTRIVGFRVIISE